jgi:hypothetical protein
MFSTIISSEEYRSLLDHSKVEGQDKLGKGYTNLSSKESGTQIYGRQGISDPPEISSFNRGGVRVGGIFLVEPSYVSPFY